MKYRCSPSVHLFGDKIEKAWGIKEWQGIGDPDKDVLFFGMYEIQDYQIYHNFKGNRTIFWCGNDIERIFQNPERMRIVREDPSVEHWCETTVQANKLLKAGIKAKIAPSFLEDIKKFPLSFKATNTPHIYLSGHPRREDEYGFYEAYEVAKRFPNVTFHLYGSEHLPEVEELPNVICHGWVTNKQFNKDIKNYQACIRANRHDGNSEIPMKAMLQGQYAITYLPYKKQNRTSRREIIGERILICIHG